MGPSVCGWVNCCGMLVWSKEGVKHGVCLWEASAHQLLHVREMGSY